MSMRKYVTFDGGCKNFPAICISCVSELYGKTIGTRTFRHFECVALVGGKEREVSIRLNLWRNYSETGSYILSWSGYLTPEREIFR